MEAKLTFDQLATVHLIAKFVCDRKSVSITSVLADRWDESSLQKASSVTH